MGSSTIVIITALCSGLVATFVTIWWQKRAQLKIEKNKIFTTLMSKRYEIASEESVEALNMIDVIFYKSPKVRAAWKNFLYAAGLPDADTKGQMVSDKHLRLLEVIAEDIGYKKIRWDDIKEYYYPVGLSDKKRDEEILRKAQINVAVAQIEKEKEYYDASHINSQEDFNNQMLLKVLDNPDGLVKLIEAAEKVQHITSSK